MRGINKIRGIIPLINAIEGTTFKLNLIGDFLEKNLKSEIEKLPGWKNVIYHGFCGRKKINEIISRSSIGMVTFLNAPNHIKTLATKPFEYMMAGLPVIMSNFEYWQSFFGDVAIYTNPNDSKAISDSIRNLLSNPNQMKSLGKKGQRLVKNELNWKKESLKLIRLYNSLDD